jgi:hypothetical protein
LADEDKEWDRCDNERSLETPADPDSLSISDWSLTRSSASLESDATTFDLRFVRPGVMDVPAPGPADGLTHGSSFTELQDQIHPTQQRILAVAREDLERLAFLERHKMRSSIP